MATMVITGSMTSTVQSANKVEVSQSKIVLLTNLQRKTTLTIDPDLTVIAQRRANDMAAQGYFSHVSPQGKRAWDFMKDAKYTYLSAGENLALNYKTDKSIVNAWMKSPGHKKNIVNANYNRIGIGIAWSGPNLYVVQLFSQK